MSDSFLDLKDKSLDNRFNSNTIRIVQMIYIPLLSILTVDYTTIYEYTNFI